MVFELSDTSNFLFATKLSLVSVRKYCVIAFKVDCGYRLKVLALIFSSRCFSEMVFAKM